jgi:transcriptional regulator with XRE-family HTH domain
MNTPDTPLSRRLRKDRKAAGLTQKQVCQLIDAVPGQLSTWEHATYRPSLGHVLALADVYRQDAMEYVALLHLAPSSGKAAERARRYRQKLADRAGAERVDAATGELDAARRGGRRRIAGRRRA